MCAIDQNGYPINGWIGAYMVPYEGQFYEPHHINSTPHLCKCKRRLSASSTSISSLHNYEITDPHLLQHVMNQQQSRLQYFDEDKKIRNKTRRLSLFGSERKSNKKDPNQKFDIKSFKSVSMRCNHHHNHLLYHQEMQQQYLQQLQQLQIHEHPQKTAEAPPALPEKHVSRSQSKAPVHTRSQSQTRNPTPTSKTSTLSDIKNKFNTCRLKKRSIYDFFNKQSNSTAAAPSANDPKSNQSNPTFYVPLPNDQPDKEFPKPRRSNGYGSQRVKSACYNPSDSNIRNLFTNLNVDKSNSNSNCVNSNNTNSSDKKCDKEFVTTHSDGIKMNSFNPHESMEMTSFLLAKLRLNKSEKLNGGASDYGVNGLPNKMNGSATNGELIAEQEALIKKNVSRRFEFFWGSFFHFSSLRWFLKTFLKFFRQFS